LPHITFFITTFSIYWCFIEIDIRQSWLLFLFTLSLFRFSISFHYFVSAFIAFITPLTLILLSWYSFSLPLRHYWYYYCWYYIDIIDYAITDYAITLAIIGWHYWLLTLTLID
jgi:hypothetical protein